MKLKIVLSNTVVSRPSAARVVGGQGIGGRTDLREKLVSGT